MQGTSERAQKELFESCTGRLVLRMGVATRGDVPTLFCKQHGRALRSDEVPSEQCELVGKKPLMVLLEGRLERSAGG